MRYRSGQGVGHRTTGTAATPSTDEGHRAAAGNDGDTMDVDSDTEETPARAAATISDGEDDEDDGWEDDDEDTEPQQGEDDDEEGERLVGDDEELDTAGFDAL